MNDKHYDKYYFLKTTTKYGEEIALYKDKFYSRFYRQSYPNPKFKGMVLYKAKRLSTIMRQRENLHDYCGMWFDVFDQDSNKVDISEFESKNLNR